MYVVQMRASVCVCVSVCGGEGGGGVLVHSGLHISSQDARGRLTGS